MQMNLFYNSEMLFIEYMDIIKATPYYLLDVIKDSKKLSEILNLEQIKYLKDIGKVEWYINRKHQNIFKELCCVDIPDSELDRIFYTYLGFDERLNQQASTLNFMSVIQHLVSQKMVKQIGIYLPYEDNSIERLFEDMGFNFKFLYGNFKDCLSEVPRDTTYVFSDIEKVNTLNSEGRLELSSVMIANEYRYNKIDKMTPKVDLVKLNNSVVFKYAIFNAFVLSR